MSSPLTGEVLPPVSGSGSGGLVRLAAVAAWRTTRWTVLTSVDAGGWVLRAVASGDRPGQILSDASAGLVGLARSALGVTPSVTLRSETDQLQHYRLSTPEALRAKGAELLRQSADLTFEVEERIHPAYERILDELAPDEARILRLLAGHGPQPAVDVRTARPLNIGSQLIAAGLTMIGPHAGLRHLDRVHAYLDNLFRLGLVWFAQEPIDPSRYHVLEAQPDVQDALKRAGRIGKTVRRSIHLTSFGTDFCEVCIPYQD